MYSKDIYPAITAAAAMKASGGVKHMKVDKCTMENGGIKCQINRRYLFIQLPKHEVKLQRLGEYEVPVFVYECV